MHILARASLGELLISHARSVAPAVCAGIDAGDLQRIVDYCLERCGHFGITREFDILRYLNLMLVFGVTFDSDEPWAAAALGYENVHARMEVLMDAALRQGDSSLEVTSEITDA
jgi:hypothetical protein